MATRYRRGDHICAVYDTEAERLRTAAEYLADGLRAGERVVYVADCAASLGRFRAALMEIGIEAEPFVERGALVECTHSAAHLAGGEFDRHRMAAFIEDALQSALEEGFAGVRLCGDMSWLLLEPAGAEQVVEYEARLNGFFRSVPAAAMCQYDRKRLRAEWLDHALATHPSVLLEGRHKANPFYVAPDLAAGRTAADADGVRAKLEELQKA